MNRRQLHRFGCTKVGFTLSPLAASQFGHTIHTAIHTMGWSIVPQRSLSFSVSSQKALAKGTDLESSQRTTNLSHPSLTRVDELKEELKQGAVEE